MRPSRGASKRAKRSVSSEIVKAVKEVKFPVETSRWVKFSFTSWPFTGVTLQKTVPFDTYPIGDGPEGEMVGRKGVLRHLSLRICLGHTNLASLPLSNAIGTQISTVTICLIYIENGAFDVADFFDTAGTTWGVFYELNPYQMANYRLLKRWDVVLAAPIVISEWVTVGGVDVPAAIFHGCGDGSAKLLVFDEDLDLPFDVDDSGVIQSGNLKVVLKGDGASNISYASQIKYTPAAF